MSKLGWTTSIRASGGDGGAGAVPRREAPQSVRRKAAPLRGAMGSKGRSSATIPSSRGSPVRCVSSTRPSTSNHVVSISFKPR